MRYLLPPCTALAVLLNISPALAGVNSLELTVSTTITPSTCLATLHDESGTANAVVDMGDVYIPQIVNKSKSRAFSLVFSDCVGLAKKQATPEASGSKQLRCASPAQQLIDLAEASDTTTIVWPLSARIVLASGSTITDLHAGSFSTQGLFTISYE